MSIQSISDKTTLNNGVQMPWLGLGVFESREGGEIENAIHTAFEQGYRSIDTASFYYNERGVGKAIQESNVPRKEIFVTTKIWNDDVRAGRTKQAFEISLEKLGLDYIDLYLIHWPVGGHFVQAWKDLEEIYQSGLVKAIGVSNFMVHHLQELMDSSEIIPTVNQVEFHPRLVQPKLRQFCKENKIQFEAWSPLMRGEIFSIPQINDLAKKYNKTEAQIVLRWDLQHEVVTIPKSAKPERIIANAQIFDFELKPEEMDLLDGLDNATRTGPDPNNFNF